jgi:hypothetical protein
MPHICGFQGCEVILGSWSGRTRHFNSCHLDEWRAEQLLQQAVGCALEEDGYVDYARRGPDDTEEVQEMDVGYRDELHHLQPGE